VDAQNQFQDLQIWHAGLSCQIMLKQRQSVLFDVYDKNFKDEFNDYSRPQNKKIGDTKYRLFLVYELRKGSPIPDGIGIEKDGENHVSLYPTGNNVPVSDIEPGHVSFTKEALM